MFCECDLGYEKTIIVRGENMNTNAIFVVFILLFLVFCFNLIYWFFSYKMKKTSKFNGSTRLSEKKTSIIRYMLYFWILLGILIVLVSWAWYFTR